LTRSTDALNDTMNISLDPIYSRGETRKIGYYEAGGQRFQGLCHRSAEKLPQMASPPIVPQNSLIVQSGLGRGGGGLGPVRGTAGTVTDPYMQTHGIECIMRHRLPGLSAVQAGRTVTVPGDGHAGGMFDHAAKRAPSITSGRTARTQAQAPRFSTSPDQ
jgi:hypothetical protein